jgi:hypothetical protein
MGTLRDQRDQIISHTDKVRESLHFTQSGE